MAARPCFAPRTRLAGAFVDGRRVRLARALSRFARCSFVHQDIHVRTWHSDAADIDTAPVPDAVIETFACDLPENVLNIIRRHKPLWLNWEYLSAEESNERLHLMPSPQEGVQKYFWFMGFSEKAAG